MSKKATIKPEYVRPANRTIFSLGMDKSMKKELFDDAKGLGRSPAQLLRMAFSYARKVGWSNVPVVE